MITDTPFLANNGNPNTVYNTTASPFAAPITLPDGSFPPITTPSWGGGPADPISYVGTMPAPTQTWGSLAPQRAPVPWAPPSPPVSTQTLPWQPVAALGGATLGDYWTHQQATGGVPVSGYADPASHYWRHMTQMAPATFNLSNSGALWGQGGGGQPAPAPAPEPSPEPTGPWQTPDPTTPVLNGGGQQVSTGGTTGMTGGYLGPGAWGGLVADFGSRLASGQVSPIEREKYAYDLGDAIESDRNGFAKWLSGDSGGAKIGQFLDKAFLGDSINDLTGKINVDKAIVRVLNAAVPGLGSTLEAVAWRGWLGEGVLNWLVDQRVGHINEDIEAKSKELSDKLWQKAAEEASDENPYVPPSVEVGSGALDPVDLPGFGAPGSGGLWGINANNRTTPRVNVGAPQTISVAGGGGGMMTSPFGSSGGGMWGMPGGLSATGSGGGMFGLGSSLSGGGGLFGLGSSTTGGGGGGADPWGLFAVPMKIK